LKRLNLILKIGANGNPVDIRNKDNQLRMIYFKAHGSIINNDMKSMIEYATKNDIHILTDVPLLFILRESKYQELLWHYTRSLFYVSQLLISKIEEGADPNNKLVIAKKTVFDDASMQLESILVTIAETEEKIKVDQVMAVDKFLNSKLLKTDINEKNVNEARQEVKDIFQKKGIGNDNSMTKMIDSISDKLTNIDLSNGNIIQSMMGIAQNVAKEMRGDLENNPDQFQKTIGAITEVFSEAMHDDKEGHVPPELKNIFGTLMASAQPGASGNSNISEEEIMKSLESVIQSNGLNRDEFFGAIKGAEGDIDVSKLENYLTNLK